MSDILQKVTISCPKCSKKGYINISEEIIKNSEKGIISIQVSKDIICDHSFIAYLDRNLDVRDYILTDFKIVMPTIEFKEKDTHEDLKKKFSIELIRINIPAMQLVFLLRSIFTGQKITIINEEKFLYEHYKNFFKYITKDSFEANITLLSMDEYKKSKNLYESSTILSGSSIIKNYNKLIDVKSLSIEKQIVSKFLGTIELDISVIMLKNEIFKIYELSRKIVSFFKEQKERGERINILKITNELEKLYNTKFNTPFIHFLLDIVKNAFKINVPSVSESIMDLI